MAASIRGISIEAMAYAEATALVVVRPTVVITSQHVLFSR